VIVTKTSCSQKKSSPRPHLPQKEIKKWGKLNLCIGHVRNGLFWSNRFKQLPIRRGSSALNGYLMVTSKIHEWLNPLLFGCRIF